MEGITRRTLVVKARGHIREIQSPPVPKARYDTCARFPPSTTIHEENIAKTQELAISLRAILDNVYTLLLS
jgi:hypothetical protein